MQTIYSITLFLNRTVESILSIGDQCGLKVSEEKTKAINFCYKKIWKLNTIYEAIIEEVNNLV